MAVSVEFSVFLEGFYAIRDIEIGPSFNVIKMLTGVRASLVFGFIRPVVHTQWTRGAI